MVIKRKNDHVLIREVDGLKIVIYDERTVYIKKGLTTYCFHRWFMRKRGFYTQHFKPFVWVLRNNRHLDLQDIIRLAYRHDLVIQSGHIPDLSEKKIKILNPRGRIR